MTVLRLCLYSAEALEATSHRQITLAPLLRAVPVAGLVGITWVLAWDTGGSIRAADWLGYAVLATIVLAVVLLSGSAVAPARLPLAACGLLVAFAAWSALSAVWSPLPSLARDDGLLALFYAVAMLTPLVTLRSAADRLVANVVVVLGLGALAVWSAVWLRERGDPEAMYLNGRLDFPVSYWNGQAAMALIAFWPAIVLAARRGLPVAVRALAVGTSAAMACLFLGTQSKGGVVALAVSAIVVFAVSPQRLRLLVPTAIVTALGTFAVRPLTEPWRAEDGSRAFDEAVRHAGTVTIVIAAVGVGVGLVYALVDRRVRIPERARLLVGRILLGLICAAALAVVVGFFASVDHPVQATQDRWEEFQDIDSGASASTNFGSLGSNRYDFWRVAWGEFERHPVLGIGAYGWGYAYLVHGESLETPQRAHSLELDALSETGVLGFLLVVGAGVLVLLALGQRSRHSLGAAGALGTAAYLTVHTGGDWVWTIPAVCLPAFVLAGIALSEDRVSTLSGRVAIGTGVAAVLAAVLAFSPPWLSARLVERAYDAPTLAEASPDLRWARRLDPLSIGPLFAESTLAEPPDDLPPLRRAIEKQPRNSELHYLLGLRLLDAGRNAEARRELRIALDLAPRNDAIEEALERAR